MYLDCCGYMRWIMKTCWSDRWRSLDKGYFRVSLKHKSAGERSRMSRSKFRRHIETAPTLVLCRLMRVSVCVCFLVCFFFFLDCALYYQDTDTCFLKFFGLDRTVYLVPGVCAAALIPKWILDLTFLMLDGEVYISLFHSSTHLSYAMFAFSFKPCGSK